MNTIKRVLFPNLTRCVSSSPAEFVNRNPRNLERLRIARKPSGYHLDKPGRSFWYKLIVTPSNRAVKAQLVHFMDGPIIEVKSSEWALRKQLYSTKDTCAFISLGQIFAQRCLEAGITEVLCDINPVKGGKMEKLLNEITKNGIKLEEPERYVKPNPWDMHRPEKPWEVAEN